MNSWIMAWQKTLPAAWREIFWEKSVHMGKAAAYEWTKKAMKKECIVYA